MYIDACGHVDASQQANKQAWYNRKYFELGYFPKKIEVPFGLRPILAFDLCQSNFGIWDPDKIE